MKLFEVEGSATVFVVLFEQLVEASKVVGGLGEALLHALCDMSPFAKGKMEFLWIFTFLPGYCTEKCHEVFCHVVLDG